MANRSDFYSAKFPRQIKRMLASMSIREPGLDSREQRLLWIDAHAAAKRFKMRQNSSPAGRATTEADIPDVS